MALKEWRSTKLVLHRILRRVHRFQVSHRLHSELPAQTRWPLTSVSRLVSCRRLVALAGNVFSVPHEQHVQFHPHRRHI